MRTKYLLVWDDSDIRSEAAATRPCCRCGTLLRFALCDVFDVEVRTDGQPTEVMCLPCARESARIQRLATAMVLRELRRGA